jgi:hypothetical protein
MSKAGQLTLWVTVGVIAIIVIYLLIAFSAANSQPPT